MPARKPHHRKPASKGDQPSPRIVYADNDIAVIDKPAGLTTVRHAHEARAFGSRAKRFLPKTLADLLPDLLSKKLKKRIARVYAVHRLDKDTSGLIVFALTKNAERQLGRQLREIGFSRKYIALVRGHAKSQQIESHLIRDRGDGRRGSSAKHVEQAARLQSAHRRAARATEEGKIAITHVRLLETIGEYSLVECELETGRTHQVRIHLGEAGTPLCGERIYDRPLHGKPLPDDSGAGRPLLHAARLQLQHPITEKAMAWSVAMPVDMKKLVGKLRRQTFSE